MGACKNNDTSSAAQAVLSDLSVSKALTFNTQCRLGTVTVRLQGELFQIIKRIPARLRTDKEALLMACLMVF
jgi:hypothetical protein